MAIKINQNIFSMLVQRNLSRTTDKLQTSTERLSSGQRINRSADDPAGMATSEQIRYEIQGLRQNQQNVSGASGMLGTAESSLSSLTNLMQRARELAVQAGNDTLNANDRQAIQTEMNQLIDETNRVASTTKFNDQSLLNGQLQNVSIQVGTQSQETLQVSLDDFRTAVLGSRAEKISDLPASGATISGGALKINGYTIPDSTADGLSTTGPAASALAKANAINNIESQTGVHAEVVAAQATGAQPVQALNIDGAVNVLKINGTNIYPISVQAGDSGGTLVAAINNRTSQTGVTASLNSSGALVLTAKDGRNIDLSMQGGVAGSLGLGAGPVNMVVAGKLDLTSTRPFTINDPAGTLGMATPLQQINLDPATALQSLSVTNANSAAQALRTLDAALAQISAGQSTLGAVQNRLDSLTNSLANRIEDLSSTDSSIRDTDFAFETARMTQSQILQEAALAMLTQANVTPRKALELLQGQ